MSGLQTYFDQIYIINLPHRTDRKKQIETQLKRVGIELHDEKITLFPAVRPENRGGFPSIGAHGCFLSHLEVLKDARARRFERILILEDDVNFSADFSQRMPKIIDMLKARSWRIFYGGHKGVKEEQEFAPADGLVAVPADCGVGATHMIAFQGDVIRIAVEYLEAMLLRPPGSSDGGPMHVDGAYSWMRRAYPEIITLAVIPELGYQRPSRTDIHDLKWFDRWPLIAPLAALWRRIKAR